MKYAPYFFFLLCLACLFAIAPASCAKEPITPIAVLEENEDIPPDTTPTPVSAPAKDGKWTNLIYFTGVGCPHCSRTDPVVLRDRVRKGDVMVFEYEIYRDNVNGPLLMEYNKVYGARLAVPQIIVAPGNAGIVSGDTPLLRSLETLIKIHKGNDVMLSTGMVSFDELSFVKLPYKPKIWFKNRLASREDSSSLQNESIKHFLLEGTLPEGCVAEKKAYGQISGSRVHFKAACRYNGWVLMYD
ncbi:MAG: hypothetical protein KAJ29_01465 [Alphaproteobacteria bacterium]|nr:hypothetical protein [Alphaproteobacteria bacterium]